MNSKRRQQKRAVFSSTEDSEETTQPLNKEPRKRISTLKRTAMPKKSVKGNTWALPASKSNTHQTLLDFATRENSCDLWSEKYLPVVESQLAVNKRKVNEVRLWLNRALVDLKPRMLILTGPAGAGKTATVRYLGHELNISLIEWINSINLNTITFQDTEPVAEFASDYVPAMRPFTEFLKQALKYAKLATTTSSLLTDSSISTTGNLTSLSNRRRNEGISSYRKENETSLANSKQIIVVEDLPFLGYARAKQEFVDSLRAFLNTGHSVHPLILIISDFYSSKDDHFYSDMERSLDLNHILPHELLTHPSVQIIKFNPVAKTFMTKLLNQVARAEHLCLPAPLLDRILLESDGDIRAAINSLQFWSLMKGGGLLGSKDNKLDIFHALGRIFYPKRQQPVTSSDLDAYFCLNLCLPEHLRESHARPPLLHSVHEVLDGMAPDPHMLSSFLHDGYPKHIQTIEGILYPSQCLSDSDIMDTSYAPFVAASSIAFESTSSSDTSDRSQNSYKSMNKPLWFSVTRARRSYRSLYEHWTTLLSQEYMSSSGLKGLCRTFIILVFTSNVIPKIASRSHPVDNFSFMPIMVKRFPTYDFSTYRPYSKKNETFGSFDPNPERQKQDTSSKLMQDQENELSKKCTTLLLMDDIQDD